MFRLFSKNFVLLIALFGLTGCILTTTPIPVNYQPADTGKQAPVKNTLTVGEIKDTRGDDPAMLMHKVNGFDINTRGKFVAEQPVSNILQTAINESLINAGYKIKPRNADMTLTGNLLNLKMKPIMGFVSGKIRCQLEVYFQLKNNKTNIEVWHDTLAVTSYLDDIELIDGKNVSASFNKAVNELIEQLKTSPGFRQALNR